MIQIIKLTFITLLCFSFWNIYALQNKKPVKKKKETQNKKLQDCKNYHKGRFIYIIYGEKILIIRDAIFQTQYRQFPNNYVKQKIEWLSDCKYRLETVEIHDPIIETNMLGRITIAEVGEKRNGDFYEYTALRNDGEFEQGLLYVIKD